MKRLPNLDALRFFLACIVIIYHVPQLSKNQGLPSFSDLPIFHKGTEAVFMFFVLSGFLIIRLIYVEKQNEVFSIKNFYMRRILRIFPLYYLITIFGFSFYHLILPFLGISFDTNYDLVQSILLTVFFFPNISTILIKPGGILEILWSIGIEEQFYLMIAPLAYFISKNKILILLISIAVLYFVVFHLPYFQVLRAYRFVYFYLFFGGIIAILEEKKKLIFLKKSNIYSLSILVLVMIYFFTNLLSFNNDLFNNLFTSILFSLFIHTLSFNNFKVEIKNKAINYLGKISYGLYMYHAIAMNIVVFIFLKLQENKIFNDSLTIFLINILTFAITILMAYMSFQYFEKPFLKLKNKFR